MKKLVFDASTLITLTVSCNLWILDRLENKVEFQMSPWVWDETIGKALHIDKFRLEGVRLNRMLKKGVLKLVEDQEARRIAERLMKVANNMYIAYGKPIDMIHAGEAEMIGLAISQGSKYVAVDERTTRLLIESPEAQKKVLETKLHTKIKVNNNNLAELKKLTRGIKVVRSVDILLYAYEKGLYGVAPKEKKNLLRGLLWMAKTKGMAISAKEITSYLNMY